MSNRLSKRYVWLIVPLLLAAVCCVLGFIINTDQWTQWFAHPERDPIPQVTRQGAELLKIMLFVATFALIVIPVGLAKFSRQEPCTTIKKRESGSLDLWIVTSLIVLGIIARATRLGESLWYDEIAAFTTYGVHEPGIIIGNLFDASNHIFHTLLSSLSVKAFEDSLGRELALRLPALIFSLGTIVCIYCLAKISINRRAAIIAGLLMAALPVAVLEGSEARGYSMMIFFTALSTLLCVITRSRDKPWIWCIYAGICALGVWTHFVFAFVTFGHAILLVWRAAIFQEFARAAKGIASLILAAVLTITLYAPAMPDLMNLRSTFITSSTSQPSVIGIEGFHALLQLGGSWYFWAAWPGLLVLLIGLAVFKKSANPICREICVASLLGLPLFVLIVLILDSWMYARFALFCLPGAVILITLGIEHIHKRNKFISFAALTFILVLGVSDLISRPAKQPLRDAAVFIADNQTLDGKVLVIGLAHQVLSVYTFDLDLTYSLRHGIDLEEKLNDINPQWIILYYPNHLTKSNSELMQDRGYEIAKRFSGWVDWDNGDVLIYKKVTGP
ncbi:MAG: glycosyltransferase family 39 protein [Planctomycetes bacterium]|nr:glycosyltransferase family 39 protein [Planctomycetota bacterium]